MSTILRALEKADKTRAQHGTPGEKAESARETQLQDEAGRHRRRATMLGVVLVAALALLVVVTLLFLARMGSSGPGEPDSAGPASSPVDQASGSGLEAEPSRVQTDIEQDLDLARSPVEPSPPDHSAVVSPETTVVAVPEPTPLPTPEPSPAPTPAPSPTPEPAPRFSASQVVWPSELGVEIQGVLEDGSNSLVLIDETHVEIGRKYKGIRPLAVSGGLVEAEYDQPGGPVILFIRY